MAAGDGGLTDHLRIGRANRGRLAWPLAEAERLTARWLAGRAAGRWLAVTDLYGLTAPTVVGTVRPLAERPAGDQQETDKTMTMTPSSTRARRGRLTEAEAARRAEAEAEAADLANVREAMAAITDQTWRIIREAAASQYVRIPSEVRTLLAAEDIAAETAMAMAEASRREHLATLAEAEAARAGGQRIGAEAKAKAEAARKAVHRTARQAAVDSTRRLAGRANLTEAEQRAASVASAALASEATGALRGRAGGYSAPVAVRKVKPWAIDSQGQPIASVAAARAGGLVNVGQRPALRTYKAEQSAEANAVAAAIRADGEALRADPDRGRTLAMHLAEARGHRTGKAAARAEAKAEAKAAGQPWSVKAKAEAARAESEAKAEAARERGRVRRIRERGNPLTASESVAIAALPASQRGRIVLLSEADLDSLLTQELRVHTDRTEVAVSGRTLASLVADKATGAAFLSAFTVWLDFLAEHATGRGSAALKAARERLASLTLAEAASVARKATEAAREAARKAEAAREAAPATRTAKAMTEAERAAVTRWQSTKAEAARKAEAAATAVSLALAMARGQRLTLASVLLATAASPEADSQHRTTGAARARKAKAEAADATGLDWLTAVDWLAIRGGLTGNGARALRAATEAAAEAALDALAESEATGAERLAEAVKADRLAAGLVAWLARRHAVATRSAEARGRYVATLAARKAEAEAEAEANREARGRYSRPRPRQSAKAKAEAEAAGHALALARSTRHREAAARAEASRRVAERGRVLAEAKAAREAARAKASRKAKATA